MAKMKTHAGAAKRFKKLKSGLIKYHHAYRRHLLLKKSRKRKRKLKLPAYIDRVDMRHFSVLLPY